ncbi:MAG: DUF1460 domain-containing protein [Candidatus Methylacidiphilales bacterium]|nr:DUF1460 domain-containing protein [Candidatus Methylacidiphilales bacterium]
MFPVLGLFILLATTSPAPPTAPSPSPPSVQPEFAPHSQPALPFETVFVGLSRFEGLLKRAQDEKWETLPIGERTATIGRALTGTPYLSHTLEIDDKIEAASVNFSGLDCWTFFETALALARLLDLPEKSRTPDNLLHFIELDRYRDGRCTGAYLSRLHYLEDWGADNHRRGLVQDITGDLGGVEYENVCREMTILWRGYRYLRATPSLVPAITREESRIQKLKTLYISKGKVAAMESKLQNGDIIGIVSRDGGRLSTSHVGLALRDKKGVLRFMHASSTREKRKVLIDDRLSDYLAGNYGQAGITVWRPLK